MTPELAKKELQDIVNRQEIGNSDIEADHSDADDILCSLLSYLGYDDIVNVYQEVGKWYA